jgi:hypothetical protein
MQKPDRRLRRLLRMRRERPCRRRAAEQRDELAPFPLIELHLTLDEPGLRRKYIQLMRFSQEVAERFYIADEQARSGHCPLRSSANLM